MEDKVSLFEMFIALITIISSAAGLKLFKLFYKWSYERRDKLRKEWRGDLIKRITTLEAVLESERKERNKLDQRLMEALIDNAVLTEKLKQYESQNPNN